MKHPGNIVTTCFPVNIVTPVVYSAESIKFIHSPVCFQFIQIWSLTTKASVAKEFLWCPWTKRVKVFYHRTKVKNTSAFNGLKFGCFLLWNWLEWILYRILRKYQLNKILKNSTYNFFISEWIEYGEVVPFFQVIKKYDLIGCYQCRLKLKSYRNVSLSLNVF